MFSVVRSTSRWNARTDTAGRLATQTLTLHDALDPVAGCDDAVRGAAHAVAGAHEIGGVLQRGGRLLGIAAAHEDEREVGAGRAERGERGRDGVLGGRPEVVTDGEPVADQRSRSHAVIMTPRGPSTPVDEVTRPGGAANDASTVRHHRRPRRGEAPEPDWGGAGGHGRTACSDRRARRRTRSTQAPVTGRLSAARHSTDADSAGR